MNTVSPINMKISLISITLACAVITSCQYRPKNFYANKAASSGVPSYDTPSYDSTPSYDTGYTPRSLGSDNINYLHNQGTTSGNWEPTSGNFVLNNGNTFEIGTDEGKVKLIASVNNLEIIELRLTNVYDGRDYSVDARKVMAGGHTLKVSKGTYRVDVRNRWETHANPAPSGTLTVEW